MLQKLLRLQKDFGCKLVLSQRCDCAFPVSLWLPPTIKMSYIQICSPLAAQHPLSLWQEQEEEQLTDDRRGHDDLTEKFPD